MQEDSSRSPSYTVTCEDYVHVVEFSPFSSGTAASLLAYGGNQYVVVGTCLFQEEDMEIEGVEFNVLRAFHHELRVDALAWSPESRLDRIPNIRFCTAASDRKLRLLTSDLQDKHEIKLMVAEKKGTIRFYDLVTQQAILSLDCGQSPLMSADWCLTNTIKVGAVAGNDWLIWDITRSSYPQEKRPAHIDKARLFKWSRANENLFATTGCPGKISSQLLIHHLGHPQPVMIGSATVGSGLSWHRTLPLCVIGGDRKLCFWMTEM
ncbi:Nucleoporin Nup37 [Nibea albiflora]|uniref:Nucleoporin Nup37 n=1 Tax=Nibea albiflora TaxID=240163 RepID=A0ACB7EUJ6_NIBAL|nr:Nucleoporin Nup37 [Nibea albiflora]